MEQERKVKLIDIVNLYDFNYIEINVYKDNKIMSTIKGEELVYNANNNNLLEKVVVGIRTQPYMSDEITYFVGGEMRLMLRAKTIINVRW